MIGLATVIHSCRQVYTVHSVQMELEVVRKSRSASRVLVYLDSVLVRSTCYRDGVAHGKSTEYYWNGRPSLVRRYSHGVPVGVALEYANSGSLIGRYEMNDSGQFIGKYTDYYENQKKKSVGRYERSIGYYCDPSQSESMFEVGYEKTAEWKFYSERGKLNMTCVFKDTYCVHVDTSFAIENARPVFPVTVTTLRHPDTLEVHFH